MGANYDIIDVTLQNNPYKIFLGSGLLDSDFFRASLEAETFVLVTSQFIAQLHLPRIQKQLGRNLIVHILPDGEEYKTLDSVEAITATLLKNRCGRESCLIAFGGGVVGDITGFVAATYQRGISYIQIPTTLLAQVDSSVGGKTGVNHSLGKNMIGAFHQPKAVYIDHSLLETLDHRNYLSGLAEVIKYGLIRDASFFYWLEKNRAGLLARDPDLLQYAIVRSCSHKAEIVLLDESEVSGERALLNLGHSFGHGIETALNYTGCLHGEAVALGMLMAARFSEKHNMLDTTSVERIATLLRAYQLPTKLPALSLDQMLSAMERDKKNRAGRLYLVLLQSIGNAILTDRYNITQARAVVKEFI